VLGGASLTSGALAIASWMTSRNIVETDGMAATIEIVITMLGAFVVGALALLLGVIALSFAVTPGSSEGR